MFALMMSEDRISKKKRYDEIMGGLLTLPGKRRLGLHSTFIFCRIKSCADCCEHRFVETSFGAGLPELLLLATNCYLLLTSLKFAVYHSKSL